MENKKSVKKDYHIVSEIDQKPIKIHTCVLKCFFVTIAIIFFAELVIMFIFDLFPHLSPFLEAFLDAFILSITITPFLYCILIRPLKKHIEKYQVLEVDLREQTITDKLTGVYNRRGFLHFAEQRLLVAERENKKELLIYVDIDNFKNINDKFGHNEGDLVLVDLTKIFKRIFRKSDILGRIGGDEFVIYLVDYDSTKERNVVQYLEDSISEYNKKNKKPYDVSISIGVSYYEPEKLHSIQQVLENADKSMYINKSEKKRLILEKKAWCPI